MQATQIVFKTSTIIFIIEGVFHVETLRFVGTGLPDKDTVKIAFMILRSNLRDNSFV